MPVSLEQWRASVGAINASGSRALARCVVRPQRGLGEGAFQLFLFLLVACSCAGVWLVVKWTVSLLKGCRRRSTWKQLALLIVRSVGGLFSSAVRHDGGLFLGCVSTNTENFSPPGPSSMDGCGQSSDIAFHIAVMDALLYLSGDVEKNPGPIQLFALVPSNHDRLQALLSPSDLSFDAIVPLIEALGLVPLMNLPKESMCYCALLDWLLGPSPSWKCLGDALAAVGCVRLSREILGAIPNCQSAQDPYQLQYQFQQPVYPQPLYKDYGLQQSMAQQIHASQQSPMVQQQRPQLQWSSQLQPHQVNQHQQHTVHQQQQQPMTIAPHQPTDQQLKQHMKQQQPIVKQQQQLQQQPMTTAPHQPTVQQLQQNVNKHQPTAKQQQQPMAAAPRQPTVQQLQQHVNQQQPTVKQLQQKDKRPQQVTSQHQHHNTQQHPGQKQLAARQQQQHQIGLLPQLEQQHQMRPQLQQFSNGELTQQAQQQQQQQQMQQQQQQQQMMPRFLTIWRGVMEIRETRGGYIQTKQLQCQITTTRNEIISDLQPQHWPQKMAMNTYPKAFFNAITQKFQQAMLKAVTFQFLTDNIHSFPMLSLMTADVKNFAIVQLMGTQNIPQCPIKALILVWNERQKGFTGLIPLEQGKFVSVVKEVLLPYLKWKQQQLGMQQQQQPQQPGQQQELGMQQPPQQKQAQIEKLLQILQLLAKSNPQQQEKILQRMTHITAEHKQQLLQKANVMRQQMLQQSQQQQQQQPPQGFGPAADLLREQEAAQHLLDEAAKTAADLLREQEAAQDLLDEAAKNGYVTAQSMVIVLVGIAGSGKSSFKRLILNLPPEKDRISTPLAEATIRNLSISRAVIGDSDAVNWEVVDSNQLLEMVAGAIKKVGAATTLTQDQTTSTSPIMASESNAADGESTYHQESSESHATGTTAAASKGTIDCEDTAAGEGATASEGTTADEGTAVDEDTEFDSEDDRLLPLIRESKGSERLFGVHWVYIIDTGGQPQFLQLLPAFIKNISSCVCFVRLDQCLNDKLLVKFFDKSGQQCGRSYPSEHTNLQLIESCVRTIHSRCSLQSEVSPNFFVIGTHLDEYEKLSHPETIKEKNEVLRTHLNSLLEESLTFYRASDTGELIFPVNCKNPEDRDKAVAAEFRKCVFNGCVEPVSKLPLAWFILEERIRQYAVKKGVVYVDRDICFKLAKKLHLKYETFQVALNHLLKLNIFRSYSSLPNLIFCDTQVVLLKLTELVQYSFQLRENTIYGVTNRDIEFKNEGIISASFLSRFPRFFSETFTPECFMRILRELLAIADLHNGKYFMPCLLKELSEKEFHNHRRSSKALSSLLLYLDGGCLPNGLFTSLIASLKNDHQWALSKKNHKAACLYQNCIQLKIPGDLPGVVTLIASFSFIEIHLNCRIESEVDKACQRVFSDVKNGLQASWNTLYPGDVSFKLAFFCSSCAILVSDAPGTSSQDCPSVVQTHYATVNDGGRFETCSRDDNCVAKLDDSKLRWLKNTNYYSNIGDIFSCMATSGTSSTTLCSLLDGIGGGVRVDIDPSCGQEVQLYLSEFKISSSSDLDQRLDWDSKGVESDLIEIANDIPDWEEKLVAGLELTPVYVSDIKSRNPSKPRLQRREALQVWKSNCGLSATYRRLLEICVAAKCDAGARAVCRVLQKKGPPMAQGEPPRKKAKFPGM